MHASPFLFLALVACSTGPADDSAIGDGTDTTSADTAADDRDGFDDDALAAELWTAIEGYSDWSHPVGRTGTPAYSDGHMGAYVVIYDNPSLASWDATGEAPTGSIAGVDYGGSRSLYPTPASVISHLGLAGSSSIFLRSSAM